MVLSSGLKDLGYKGNCFTWANNRLGQAYVAARLDRAFSNSSWLNHFPDPSVQHLPRISSDRSPLLFSHNSNPSLKNSPFKFEEMWLTHSSFKYVVERSWSVPIRGNPQYKLAQKLKSLKDNLKAWNIETFGQLKINISEAEAATLQAQSVHDEQPSDKSLQDLNSKKATLHNWLNVESTQ